MCFVSFLPRSTVCNATKLVTLEGSSTTAQLNGWSQAFNDQFDWVASRASTGQVHTGPHVDHTYGNSSGRFAVTVESPLLTSCKVLGNRELVIKECSHAMQGSLVLCY